MGKVLTLHRNSQPHSESCSEILLCPVATSSHKGAQSKLHGVQLPAEPRVKGATMGRSAQESTEAWWVFLMLITVTDLSITLNSPLSLEHVIQR